MTSAVQGIDLERGEALMRAMLRIRLFETRLAVLKETAEVLGSVHLYVGQEAVAAGVCEALRPDDYVASNHRGHGHVIAKGGDLRKCMAELYAKETGYCRGKGGSMHIADVDLGIIGANGVVGAGIPIAVGAALAAKLRGTDQVSVVFFGDGGANQGTFGESLNLASVWSLPVIFVCENNGYTELMPTEQVTAGTIAERAAGYGVVGKSIDGNDAFEVFDTASEAVERARAGEGPTLIEAVTYRIHNHSEGLERIAGKTRADEEVEEWRKRDPIDSLHRELLAAGVEEARLGAVRSAIDALIEDAVEFARQSPAPDPATAFDDVWAGELGSAAAFSGQLR